MTSPKQPLTPRLPRAPLPVVNLPEFEDEGTYRRRHYQGPGDAHAELRGATFEGARFSDVNWTRSQWNWVRFTDVEVQRCTLAGAEWEQVGWTRVEITSSRLLGFNATDLLARHVTIRQCDARLSTWFAARFTNATFERCDLREAHFTGADLRGVRFVDCDLSRADFRDAQLDGADLRGTKLDGIRVGLKELQGAIIETVQLPSLAFLLGVTVLDR